MPVRADVKPGFLLDSIPSQGPDDAESWSDIEKDLHQKIMPGLCHWTHPGFMAYFPASSTYEGILGELYGATFNNPAFDWICSPAITELELVMGDWVGELLGLPQTLRGNPSQPASTVIQGTTTECLLVTMVAARDWVIEAIATDEDEGGKDLVRNRLVALASSETHVSTRKAAAVAGVKFRMIECDPSSGVAMTGSHLQDAVDQCLREDLIPFYATATFGTTNSCAVDDFRSIAEVKKRRPEIWIHVDGAYAGAALACEELRAPAKGMEDFDSFSVNLGKWLLTNLDCTMLFVRKQSTVMDSMKNDCAIVENPASADRAVTDYRDLQLAMGRRFRSLKVWFVLRSWGKDGIRRNIRRHIDMAASFSSWIDERSDLFVHATKPQFALNVLRVSDQAAQKMGASPDSATLKLYNAVSANKGLWLSKTRINGYTTIRVLAANPKSTLESLRFVFDTLCGEMHRLIDDVNV